MEFSLVSLRIEQVRNQHEGARGSVVVKVLKLKAGMY
jgi:hypothetical protein